MSLRKTFRKSSWLLAVVIICGFCVGVEGDTRFFHLGKNHRISGVTYL